MVTVSPLSGAYNVNSTEVEESNISISSSSPVVNILTEDTTDTDTDTDTTAPKPITNRVLCRNRVWRVRFEEGIKFPIKKLRQSTPRISKNKNKNENTTYK
jgi:hypothetical protein